MTPESVQAALEPFWKKAKLVADAHGYAVDCVKERRTPAAQEAAWSLLFQATKQLQNASRHLDAAHAVPDEPPSERDFRPELN